MRKLSERSIRIKKLLPNDIGMGTFGLIELELLEFDKEIEELQGQVKNNVALHNVSNQRELLIAYIEYCMGKENIEVVRDEYLKEIDAFLSNL